MLKVSDVGQTASLSFADPAKIRAGDWVVAVGHPFGLEQTLTAEIISPTDRSVGSVSDSFLQVNASMNPGDSGGPLLNLDGEVIGINSLVFRQGTSNVGIGFALSGAAGKPLIDQLAARGHVTRSWLGVTVQDITADLANSLGIKQDAGVVVADVWPNSPAAKAGIQRGDVIAAYKASPFILRASCPAAWPRPRSVDLHRSTSRGRHSAQSLASPRRKAAIAGDRRLTRARRSLGMKRSVPRSSQRDSQWDGGWTHGHL